MDKSKYKAVRAAAGIVYYKNKHDTFCYTSKTSFVAPRINVLLILLPLGLEV